MFTRIARLVVRHPALVVTSWAVAAAAMLSLALLGVGDGNLFDRAATGIPTVGGADSTYVYEQRLAYAPTDVGPTLTVKFIGVDMAEPSAADRITAAAREVASRNGVIAVVTPFGVTPGPSVALASASGGPSLTPDQLVSIDGSSFLVSVSYAPFASDAAALTEHRAAGEILERAAYDQTASTPYPPAEALIYSNPLLYNDFTTQIQDDLETGETIALPVALLVMVLVFGGFLAASAPVIGALASIAGGLAILFGFSYPIELDQSAINVVTVLGIGLSIDYGLLIVSRYREEMARLGDHASHDVRGKALEATLTTAGRTVFFSAITVAIAVGGMLVFSATLIRGIGGAALGVVIMALASALTLVPAVLYLYGHRIARPSVLRHVPFVRAVLKRTADVSSEEGFFSSLARTVQRRPWLVVGGVTAVLLVLASPLADVAVRNSDVQLLPVHNERREFLNDFEADYPALADPQIQVLAEAPPAELDAWMASLTSVEGVTKVTAAKQQGDAAVAAIFTAYPDQAGPEATELVRTIRELEVPFRVYLGDQAAIQVDFVDSLAGGAPWAIGLVVLATFVLLFLMTGSVLVPVKTLLINALSLAASIGILTWIFVDGHLERLLDFSATGGIETYVLVMIVAFGFGLAMDYEVFLLSRIKEHVDAGESNDEAVRKGLQRSGRIITSAATVIILVFMGFAAGQLLVIKEVGIGLAVAVFLDATLVRMLLVPATMTLLGHWNWWAPAPLRRLYDRRGITH